MRALEAAREHDVHRFLFVSSDGLYGGIQDPSQPVIEDTPARGEGLYPIAKVASEAVCKRYRALYGLEAVSGRRVRDLWSDGASHAITTGNVGDL